MGLFWDYRVYDGVILGLQGIYWGYIGIVGYMMGLFWDEKINWKLL